MKGNWSKEEDTLLLDLRDVKKIPTWVEISSYFHDKNSKQCSYRYKKLLHISDTNKWSKEDDLKLAELVEYFGENFGVMKNYFNGKTEIDLQTRYYKKINHKNIAFTAEEDQVIMNMYNKVPLTNMERKIIKIKGSFAVKKRLEILLKLKGEEMDKSFNLSSCLSSSYSSVHNSNLMKIDEIVESGKQRGENNKEICFQAEKIEYKNTKTPAKLKGKSCRASNKGKSSQNIGNPIKSHSSNLENLLESQNEKKQNENTEIQSFHSYLPSMDAEFNADISNPSISNYNDDMYRQEIKQENNNNLIFEKDIKMTSDKDKSCYTNYSPSAYANLAAPLINHNTNMLFSADNFNKESTDSFETSFYDVFNNNSQNKNDFFYEFNDELDLDQVLNQYTSSNIVDLVQKNKSLESILNQVHEISDTFEKQMKNKFKDYDCSEKTKRIFIFHHNDLVQKEKKLRHELELQKRQFMPVPQTSQIQKSENEIKKELTLRIDNLMKLTEVIKAKILLSQKLTKDHSNLSNEYKEESQTRSSSNQEPENFFV